MNAMIFCWIAILVNFGQPAETVSSIDDEKIVLAHYEGRWDSEFTIHPIATGEATQAFKGVVGGKWVVGDKFLEQTGTYQLSENAPPFVVKTMMSFDEKHDRYQFDYFYSSGDVLRGLGQWNEETKTMTCLRKDAEGSATTIIADFSTENVETWSIEIKDSEGKTTTKITGTNTRRK